MILMTITRLCFCLALLSSSLFAEEAKWISLFDGKTLDGWTDAGKANWRVEDGAITVNEGEIGLLIHKDTYKNFELELEFKAAKGANSGIFLNTKKKVTDEAVDCYEVNIAGPENSYPTGSIVKFVKYTDAGETDAWRKYEMKVIDGHIVVKLDGKKIIDFTTEKSPPGPWLGLQKNDGLVAFRNIKVRKLP